MVRRIGKSRDVRVVVVLMSWLAMGCAANQADMNESQRAQVREAVERRMQSFEAAERALNGEALIGHFAESPDFYLYNDGERLDRDAMAAGVRAAFPGLRSIEGGFSDLKVVVLAPDAALATTVFRETITDRAGSTTRQRGAATWLWKHDGGEWRIAYGHVDHYPDAGTK
jgi:uncharacterized protein (TIGR02246 family)